MHQFVELHFNEQHKCVDGFSHVHNGYPYVLFAALSSSPLYWLYITTRIVEYLLQAVQRRINDLFLKYKKIETYCDTNKY